MSLQLTAYLPLRVRVASFERPCHLLGTRRTGLPSCCAPRVLDVSSAVRDRHKQNSTPETQSEGALSCPQALLPLSQRKELHH